MDINSTVEIKCQQGKAMVEADQRTVKNGGPFGLVLVGIEGMPECRLDSESDRVPDVDFKAAVGKGKSGRHRQAKKRFRLPSVFR